MRKPLLVGLVLSSIIALGVLTIVQTGTIRNLKSNISKISKDVTHLNGLIDNQNSVIEDLESENFQLILSNQTLKDSITGLNMAIEELNTSVSYYKSNVAAIQSELDKKSKALATVNKKLSTLTEQTKAKEQAITQMQQQESDLKRQVEELNALLLTATEKAQEATENVALAEIQKLEMDQLNSVINETLVVYNNVRLTKEREGSPISKLRKNGKNWRYTTVTLDLHNQLPMIIADETFELRIVDLDTNKPLPFIEANPAYGSSPNESLGLRFQYKGNPTEVTFINMDEKTGENYEMQLYYYKNDTPHLINNSVWPILFEGKAL